MTVYFWQVYKSHKHAEHQRWVLETFGTDGGLLKTSGFRVRNAKVSKTKKGRYRIKWTMK